MYILKYLASFLLISLIVLSCGSQKKDTPVEPAAKPVENGQEFVVKFYADSTPQTRYTVLNEDSTRVKVQIYHKNGSLSIEGIEEDGKRTGEWTAWDDKGAKQSSASYAEGLAEGKKTVFFANGQIRYQGMMKGGKMVGIWRFYNPNGDLVKEEDYDKKP